MIVGCLIGCINPALRHLPGSTVDMGDRTAVIIRGQRFDRYEVM